MANKPVRLAHMSVAWDTEAETLVEMPPQGDETVVGPIRKQCRAGRIVCGIAGCVDPRLTARRASTGQRRRIAHFAHMPRGGAQSHGPETLEHLLVKYELGQLGTSAGYQVEHERWSPEANRRPDVTMSGHGWRIAFEVQYSELELEVWEQRTADLSAAGYDRVVWVWGRRGLPYETVVGGFTNLPAIDDYQGRFESVDELWFAAVAADVKGVFAVRFAQGWPAACDGRLLDQWDGALSLCWATPTATPEGLVDRCAADAYADRLVAYHLQRLVDEKAAEEERVRLERLAAEARAYHAPLWELLESSVGTVAEDRLALAEAVVRHDPIGTWTEAELAALLIDPSVDSVYRSPGGGGWQSSRGGWRQYKYRASTDRSGVRRTY